MGIFTTSRATVAMTSTTTAPATYDAAGYAALSYTNIGSLESIGKFGDESSEVTFDDIAIGRTIKIKGQRNAGTMSLVIGLDDANAGQALIRTAEADNSTGDYNFKVTFNNKLSSGGTNAVRYFSGKVMSAAETLDTANNVVKLETAISINTAVVRVNAT